MNKFIRISLVIFATLFLAFFVCFSFITISHIKILKNNDKLVKEYSNFVMEKNEFVLKTKILEINGVDELTFTIYSSFGDVVYDSYDDEKCKWRLMDFESISFLDNSLDIVVKSNDTGTDIFLYKNGVWMKQERNIGDG